MKPEVIKFVKWEPGCVVIERVRRIVAYASLGDVSAIQANAAILRAMRP